VHDLESTTRISHELLRFNYRHRDLTALPPPFRYVITVTTDPAGSRWSWRVNSLWGGPNYFVLNEIPPG
jgi:hypothetical protein